MELTEIEAMDYTKPHIIAYSPWTNFKWGYPISGVYHSVQNTKVSHFNTFHNVTKRKRCQNFVIMIIEPEVLA